MFIVKGELVDEDNFFREFILECMFKVLGLVNNGIVKDMDFV